MSDEPQQTIKVIDKRRSARTEDSESRSDARPENRQQPPQAARPDSTAAERSGPSADGSVGSDSARSGENLERGNKLLRTQPDVRVKLIFHPLSFLFYTQALIMLGEVPNPETGLVSANMEAARQTIDILEMIEAKTKGNLSQDESRLISEVVASLQMAYVNKLK